MDASSTRQSEFFRFFVVDFFYFLLILGLTQMEKATDAILMPKKLKTTIISYNYTCFLML